MWSSLSAFLPKGQLNVCAEYTLSSLFRIAVQRARSQQVRQRDHPDQASVLPVDWPFGAFRGQKGARPHGNAGILGSAGNVVSVTYRI
jgi:hypothetical protein